MMLTEFTQAAIAVLHDIFSGNTSQSDKFSLSTEEQNFLLHKLEAGGLICRLPGKEEGSISSYTLLYPLHKISLLDLLTVLNEPIHCNRTVSETAYSHHEMMATKMGVLMQVTRTFLSDIKLTDW